MSKLEEKLAEKVGELKEKVANGRDEVPEAVVVGETSHAEVVAPSNDDDGRYLSVVPEFAITLQEAEQRIQMLQEFVKRYMMPSQDYGMIPGCQKPSLFKPGAEKLTDIFGLSKHVEVLDKVEDWEKPFLHYQVKVTLVNKRSGYVEAEGIGSANSKENKFARQDTYTIANTLLKMAKKRALIDAVLSATRSSGIFSQDLEDLKAEPQEQRSNPIHTASKQPVPAQKKSPQDSNDKATGEQLQRIYTLAEELSLSPQKAKMMMKIQYRKQDSRELTREQAADFIEKLKMLQESI